MSATAADTIDERLRDFEVGAADDGLVQPVLGKLAKRAGVAEGEAAAVAGHEHVAIPVADDSLLASSHLLKIPERRDRPNQKGERAGHRTW